MEQSSEHDKAVGRRVRILRTDAGLTVGDLARQLSTSRRQVRAWERGKQDVPEGARRAIADVLGLPMTALVPDRDMSRVRLSRQTMSVGGLDRTLDHGEEVLPSYLDMVYRLRGMRAGEPMPFRNEDLDALAEALGSEPRLVEERLLELVSCSAEEAAELRSMIVRRRMVTSVAGVAAGALTLGGVSAADLMGSDSHPQHIVETSSQTDGSPPQVADHSVDGTAEDDEAPTSTTSTTAAGEQRSQRLDIGEPLLIERQPTTSTTEAPDREPQIGDALLIERDSPPGDEPQP